MLTSSQIPAYSSWFSQNKGGPLPVYGVDSTRSETTPLNNTPSAQVSLSGNSSGDITNQLMQTLENQLAENGASAGDGSASSLLMSASITEVDQGVNGIFASPDDGLDYIGSAYQVSMDAQLHITDLSGASTDVDASISMLSVTLIGTENTTASSGNSVSPAAMASAGDSPGSGLGAPISTMLVNNIGYDALGNGLGLNSVLQNMLQAASVPKGDSYGLDALIQQLQSGASINTSV